MTTSLPSLPSLFISSSGSVARPRSSGGSPVSPVSATEYGGCKIGGCCDCSQVSSTGTNMCMGCSGAMSAADCGDQTYVPCPPNMCFVYGGKFAYNPGASWAPSACQ